MAAIPWSARTRRQGTGGIRRRSSQTDAAAVDDDMDMTGSAVLDCLPAVTSLVVVVRAEAVQVRISIYVSCSGFAAKVLDM
jgi:hypothetical protein